MWHNDGMKNATKKAGAVGPGPTAGGAGGGPGGSSVVDGVKSGGVKSSSGGEDIREFARAMNRLADAINELTALAREAKAENPDWAVFPSTLIDLSKRLTTLATRLR